MRPVEAEVLDAIRHLDAVGQGSAALVMYQRAVSREVKPRLLRSEKALRAYTDRRAALQARMPPPPFDEEAARTLGRGWALELQRISRAVPVDAKLDELSVTADFVARQMDAEIDAAWTALLSRLGELSTPAAREPGDDSEASP